MHPMQILRNAIKAVPAVKYALAVAGVVAVVAIVAGLRVDYRVAIIGGLIVLLGMVLLVTFASLAGSAQKNLRAPAIVLTWFALLMLMLTSCLLLTCVFFAWPQDLVHWIAPRDNPQQDPEVIHGGTDAVEPNTRTPELETLQQMNLAEWQAMSEPERRVAIKELPDYVLSRTLRRLFDEDADKFEYTILNCLPYDELAQLFWRVISQRENLREEAGNMESVRDDPANAQYQLKGYLDLMEQLMLQKMVVTKLDRVG